MRQPHLGHAVGPDRIVQRARVTMLMGVEDVERIGAACGMRIAVVLGGGQRHSRPACF